MGNSQGRPVVFTDQVNLDHFKLLRVVGKGAFGKVRIVERKDTGLTFALKYIRKDEVVRQENVRNIIRERKMLQHLNHPFLCNLRYCFQDYEYLYLVIDLMNGGDLRFHITRKTFEERTVRFWMAELGCALRYVHSQGIVHRDVKPDNVMLDSDGHVHLADFNVAADYTNPKRQLTSKSGTLAYLAPEVYEEGPYKCEVDWWSLGVCFYECIYGKRPFDARNHDDLERKVKDANPRYPTTEPRVDTACVFAIKSLLCKKIHDRIGANGFDNYKKHPFFLPIDFDLLEKKQVRPVFIPSSEKTNFDATYDLEELLLEEAPLEARARHQKPRPKLKPDASDQEKRAAQLHELIEQYFEPFDYTQASFDKLSGEGESTEQSDQSCAVDDTKRKIEEYALQEQNNGSLDNTAPAASQSQTNSQDGSPPLTSRASLPHLNQTRTVDQNTQPNDTVSPSKSMANRSKSVSTNTRTSTWTDNASVGPRGLNAQNQQQQQQQQQGKGKGKKGILAVLSGKKTRGKSPSSARRYPEGVLGKDGARVWLKD